MILLGMAVGICLSLVFRSFSGREVYEDVRKDTAVVYDTAMYSRLKLSANTIRLEVPDPAVPEVVFIREDSMSVVYRDSIRYVSAPREYYFTKTQDAEIWHSGIGSRIDSLVVFHKNSVVTEVKKDKPVRHSLTAYGEMGYMEGISMKAGMRYLYHPRKWMGMGLSVERDFALKQTGVYGNLEMTLGWN